MTASTAIGLPQLPTRRRVGQVTTFNYVPQLRDLMPRTAGLPGMAYAQVCLHNVRNVLADTTTQWYKVEGTDLYTIKGAKGEAEMMLVCTGKPIPGQDTHTGKRICWFDEDIQPLTGWETPAAYTTSFKGPRSRSLLEETQSHGQANQVETTPEGRPGQPLAEALADVERRASRRPQAQRAQASDKPKEQTSPEAVAPLGG